MLTFTHTVGEFGVVLMLGGNIPGATRTLSISLYDQVQDFNYAAANRTALVLLGFAIVALLVIYLLPRCGRWMEGRLTLSDRLPRALLAVRMKHRVGALSLDVEFALTKPWTVLFGPSGSGKTTVLRAIAGFVRPEAEL